jgi:hypothetical protein
MRSSSLEYRPVFRSVLINAAGSRYSGVEARSEFVDTGRLFRADTSTGYTRSPTGEGRTLQKCATALEGS